MFDLIYLTPLSVTMFELEGKSALENNKYVLQALYNILVLIPHLSCSDTKRYLLLSLVEDMSVLNHC